MLHAVKTCFKALIILVSLSAAGIVVNHFSAHGIPMRYQPPPETLIAGLKVPLIDAEKASKYLKEPGYVFVDTRHLEHFNEGHVPGAVFLPPQDVQDRFIEVQPFLQENDTLILYCYGADCDMAEKTAEFLAQMGYNKFMIMAAGFSAWKSAGHPTEIVRR